MKSVNITRNMSKEGFCPTCHSPLKFISSGTYFCIKCEKELNEEVHCSKCNQVVEVVSGCGSVNYICKNDGLVSSSNVIFYYIPN